MAARLSRAVKPDGPVMRTADNSAKGKQLLLMAGNKSPTDSSSYAADMRQQAALAEQARADRKRQIVRTINAARKVLLEAIREVKDSRDLDRINSEIKAAKEAGLGSDSQAVLMAEELAQEIRRQEARAKREAAELAAQHAAVHQLSNRERSQITTVYHAFKNKQTGDLPGYHLKTLFVALGVKIRTRAIREMLKKINKTSTDPVTLDEFTFLAARNVQGRGWTGEIETKFAVMSEPHKVKHRSEDQMFITFRRLKVLNQELARGQTDEQLEQMIEIADANNDNLVDSGEFYSLLNTGRQLDIMLKADNRRNYKELKATRVAKAHRMLSEVYKETLGSMDREKLTQALRKAFEAGMDEANDLVQNVKQYIRDLIQIEKY